MTDLRTDERAGKLARRNNSRQAPSLFGFYPPLRFASYHSSRALTERARGPAIAGYYAYGTLHKQG